MTVRGTDVRRVRLDAVVQRDHVQHVQELPLVLVDALDLDVEHRVHDRARRPCPPYDGGELFLVRLLDLLELGAEALVVGELLQLLELGELGGPALADASVIIADSFGFACSTRATASRRW